MKQHSIILTKKVLSIFILVTCPLNQSPEVGDKPLSITTFLLYLNLFIHFFFFFDHMVVRLLFLKIPRAVSFVFYLRIFASSFSLNKLKALCKFILHSFSPQYELIIMKTNTADLFYI